VPLNVTQHWNKHDFVQVDTSDILFIAAGTFSDLALYGDGEKTIGMLSDGKKAKKAKERRIGMKELTDYGMLPELLGRLPVIVQLDPLDEDQLIDVLSGPPDSIVREYQALLAADDVKLELSEAALREMVRFAMHKRLGARGLRGIVEDVCADVMFEAPERRGETLRVDADYVRERLAQKDA
jgi:ATP-dependent Clp protease ATP-binding subunit ClpX